MPAGNHDGAGGAQHAHTVRRLDPDAASGAAALFNRLLDIKDKSGSASGAKTPGGVTTGAAPSGQANNAKGTGNTQTRPAGAAGLPNC